MAQTFKIDAPSIAEFEELKRMVEELTGKVAQISTSSLNYGSNKAYSISQAARLVGFDRSVIYRAIERNDLKASKPMGKWRITSMDLESWANSRR